jgi:rhodanese-related sulfurtransferase
MRPSPVAERGDGRGSSSTGPSSCGLQPSELPQDEEIVAYCRGLYCVYSDQAVRLLHSHGLRARRISEAFPERRATRRR